MVIVEISKKIKNKVLILQKLNKSLTLLSKENSDIAQQYSVLVKEIPKMEGLISDLHQYDSLISEIKKNLEDSITKRDEIQSGLGAKIGSNLASLLQTENIQLKGRYPLFNVLFYTIEVDFQNGKATIWFGPDKIEKLNQCKSSPEEIKKTLLKCHKQITERKFDEEKFLNLLYRSYLSVLNDNGKKEGDDVGITDILPYMALFNQPTAFKRDPRQKNYREYDRSQFAFDLARVWAGQKKGFSIKFSPASRIDTKTWYTFIHIPPLKLQNDWQHIAGLKMIKQVE